MLSSAMFAMPNWHFGAYFVQLDHLYEEIGLKWHTFRKGMFLSSSISRQLYHIESWNLVQSCFYRLLFYKHISLVDNHIIHGLLNLKCKGRLPLPQKILNFEQYDIVWMLCRMHEKQQLNYTFMFLSATFVMPDSHFWVYFVKLDCFFMNKWE